MTSAVAANKNEVSVMSETAKDIDAIRSNLANLQWELNDAILERNEVVHGAILAILTNTHIFMYGSPGTAKSMLSELIAESFGVGYGRWLLSRNTKPAEVFGAVNIKHLKEHGVELLNIERKLPSVVFAFLDEFFKCNPTMLNGFLTILEERKFDAGDGMKRIPLRTCFTASNEIPIGDPVLSALYDRILQRFVVPYLQDDKNFTSLLADTLGQVSVRISEEELNIAQKDISKVLLNGVCIKGVMQVRAYLETKFGIIVSDRRWKQSMKLAKAQAWLNGRYNVILDDLKVMRNTLWNDPADLPKIDEALQKLENPKIIEMKKLNELFDKEFAKYKGNQNPQMGAILGTMQDIGKQMKKLIEEYEKSVDCDTDILTELNTILSSARSKLQAAIKKESDLTS